MANEAYRLCMSMTPISKFRKSNGMVVQMEICNYGMYMMSCTLCLKLQYRWRYMASHTPSTTHLAAWFW
jgi:hypothetical protein